MNILTSERYSLTYGNTEKYVVCNGRVLPSASMNFKELVHSSRLFNAKTQSSSIESEIALTFTSIS